jgi:hypothetical protein
MLVLCLATGALQSLAAAELTSAQPRMVFATNRFDFGKVRAGEVVTHAFVFTNAGTATLEVTEVKPGCGCTTAGDWDGRVEPGKAGAITLQFNSTALTGTVLKTATVSCNDPAQTNVLLYLGGTVWKPIDTIPAMAFFYVSSETVSNESRVVRLISNLEQPITVSNVQCTNEAFRTELSTVTPGKEFELRITAVPPFVTPSTLAVVTMKTSAPEAPSLSVNAYIQVQPAVTVAPSQMTLPATGVGSNYSAIIVVRNNGTNALELSDARVDPPEIKLLLQESERGRLFNVVLSFPPGLRIPPGQKAAVTMKTNHPRFPLLSVPIIQLPPSVSMPSVRPAQAAVMANAPAPGTRVIPSRISAPVSTAK